MKKIFASALLIGFSLTATTTFADDIFPTPQSVSPNCNAIVGDWRCVWSDGAVLMDTYSRSSVDGSISLSSMDNGESFDSTFDGKDNPMAMPDSDLTDATINSTLNCKVDPTTKATTFEGLIILKYKYKKVQNGKIKININDGSVNGKKMTMKQKNQEFMVSAEGVETPFGELLENTLECAKQ